MQFSKGRATGGSQGVEQHVLGIEIVRVYGGQQPSQQSLCKVHDRHTFVEPVSRHLLVSFTPLKLPCLGPPWRVVIVVMQAMCQMMAE